MTSEPKRRAERAKKLKQVGRRIKHGSAPESRVSPVKRAAQIARQQKRRKP